MIPHDFGFQKMINFIINNQDILKNKIEMIDSLINMKVDAENDNDENNLISIYYNNLDWEINHISPNEKIYSILLEYLINTTKYNKNIKILNYIMLILKVKIKIKNNIYFGMEQNYI